MALRRVAAPTVAAKPRPKAPFDLTGVWLHGGGQDNSFRFSPPTGFKLTPAAQVHYEVITAMRDEQQRLIDEADRLQRAIDALEKEYQDLTTPRPVQ